jgi:hypothetical protein
VASIRCSAPSASVGWYDPTTATFYLSSSNSGITLSSGFAYGPADAIPITGDWSGNDIDTVGWYDPSTSVFYLRNSNTTGFADTAFVYGSGSQSPAWVPLAGIWTDSAGPSFTATAVSDTQINLSWSTVSGASGYLVDELINGVWTQTGSYGGEATGCSVTGPSPGTTYYFDVAAYNAAGTSWANCQSATTSGGAAVDHPAAATVYTPVSGSLFSASGPSYLDVHQGYVGDCWLMASLAEVAARDPADVQNMFTYAGTTTENGSVVDLYKVRLYNSDGAAGYFTVDTELPGGGSYYDQVTNGVLWVALAEKAYAEANYTASSSTPFEVYNPWGINAAASDGVYGLFSADATFLSQNYDVQSFGTGAAAGMDGLSNANTHNRAAVNAVMAEWTHTDVGDALDPTGYKMRRNHLLDAPAAGPNGTCRLNSTVVSKDVGITDYLYGDRDDHHKHTTDFLFDGMDTFLESIDTLY